MGGSRQAHGASGTEATRWEMTMFSVVGLLGAGAGTALVICGAMVRRAVERDGLDRAAASMPAGAAHEAS